MDLDRLEKEFRDFKARVEPMLADYEDHLRDRRRFRDEPQPAAGTFDSGVTDENRDEIMKPLTPAPTPELDAAAKAEADLDAQRLKNNGLTDAELAAATAKAGPFGATAGAPQGGPQDGQKPGGEAPKPAEGGTGTEAAPPAQGDASQGDPNAKKAGEAEQAGNAKA